MDGWVGRCDEIVHLRWTCFVLGQVGQRVNRYVGVGVEGLGLQLLQQTSLEKGGGGGG